MTAKQRPVSNGWRSPSVVGGYSKFVMRPGPEDFVLRPGCRSSGADDAEI
jgi:hypothetical protein